MLFQSSWVAQKCHQRWASSKLLNLPEPQFPHLLDGVLTVLTSQGHSEEPVSVGFARGGHRAAPACSECSSPSGEMASGWRPRRATEGGPTIWADTSAGPDGCPLGPRPPKLTHMWFCRCPHPGSAAHVKGPLVSCGTTACYPFPCSRAPWEQTPSTAVKFCFRLKTQTRTGYHNAPEHPARRIRA